MLKDFPVGIAQREVSFNQDVKALIPTESLDELFFSFLLVGEKHRVKDMVTTAGHGTGRLDTETFKAHEILLPPVPEQRKIAKILQAWDRSIATTEQLIVASQLQKKALMQQLLTGKMRLLDANGVRFHGEWEEVRLGTLCRVRRGASPRPIRDSKWFSGKGRGWIRISDVTAQKGSYLLKTTQYLSDAGVDKSVSVDPGDLIMSICGTIGVPKFLGIEACIHDGFVVFREVSNRLSVQFLYYLLHMKSTELAAGGQPGTQKNLNTSIVSEVLVPVVSVNEQNKIAQVLTAADREADILQTKLTHLKQEKKALMQQLLTGKRRVVVDAEEAA